MQTTLQYGQMYYEGSGIPNGVPAYLDKAFLYTLGGFQNVADTGGNAQFGYLMSSSPTDSSGDGSFYMGIPSGYSIRGIIKYDAGVAMNDPAKPNYILQGAPLTLVFKGTLWYYSWDTTCVGAGVPYIGSVIAIQNSTGVIDFLPNGTTATQVPTGWTVLPNSLIGKSANTQWAQVKSYDPLLNAALVYFQL